MPDLSSNLTTIRGSGYRFRYYLSVPTETEVLRGTVTAVNYSPTTQITYTNVSGSHTDVLQDMEIEVFRSGASIGRLRVAPGGATSTTLQIEELAQARLLLAPSDEFRVYRSWRVRTRLVGASASLPKDSRVAVGSYTDAYRPVAIAGGGTAGFVSGGVFTASFSASGSYTVDPDSSGTLTYSWDVDDGTITVGTSTSASITVEFPAGFRFISLTVTDSSNSQSATQYIPVWAHERTGSNAPKEIVISDLSGDRENGWSCTFECLDGSTQTALPDGSLVYVWAEEWYGSTQASYGAAVSGRSHIKFVGYLSNDNSISNGEQNQQDVVFRAVSPLQRLAQLAGFSQAVERVASSPANWLQATGLSTRVMMDYLLRWGSTFLVCHDFVNTSTNYDYPAFYLQQSTPLAQLRELADSVDVVLTCDKLGRLLCYPDPVISNTTARNALTTTLTLTADDVLSIEGTREHYYRIAQLEGQGITAGTTTGGTSAVFSRSPGLTPADAPQFTSRERLIVSNQTNLNQRTGYRFALENHLYFGLPTYEDVRLELRGGYDVFDFLPEWLRLTISSSYNARGIAWGSSSRYVISRISINIDAETGTKTVSLTADAETDGFPGETYIPPADPTFDLAYPDVSLDFPYFGIEAPTVTVDAGSSLIVPEGSPVYVYATGGGTGEVARGALNPVSGAITWTDINPSATVTGTPIWASGDPHQANHWYVLTTTGLWKTTDKTASPPAWTQVSTNTDMFGGSTFRGGYFEFSINRPGWIGVTTGDKCIAWTTNYGANWSLSAVDNGTPTPGTVTTGVCPLAVSYYNSTGGTANGWIYSAYHAGGFMLIRLNTNWGQGSWTTVYTQAIGAFTDPPVRLGIGYKRPGGAPNKNDNNQIIWYQDGQADAQQWGACTKGGASLYNYVGAAFVGDTIRGDKRVFNIYTLDGSYVRGAVSTGGSRYVTQSTNGGSDLTRTNIPLLIMGAQASSSFNSNINGWGNNPDVILHFGPELCRYTPDAGVNWYNLITLTTPFSSYVVTYAELSTS